MATPKMAAMCGDHQGRACFVTSHALLNILRADTLLLPFCLGPSTTLGLFTQRNGCSLKMPIRSNTNLPSLFMSVSPRRTEAINQPALVAAHANSNQITSGKPKSTWCHSVMMVGLGNKDQREAGVRGAETEETAASKHGGGEI